MSSQTIYTNIKIHIIDNTINNLIETFIIKYKTHKTAEKANQGNYELNEHNNKCMACHNNCLEKV